MAYQKQAAKVEVKDDRPADNISFAATNLVKPGIQSRRQQSEPPNNRNVFPPTPPPEADRPTRGQSVRNGQKPPLAKLNIQTQEQNRKYEKAVSPQEAARARPGRSASAMPAGTSRAPSRRTPRPIEEGEDAYPDELYDMYQGGGAPRDRGSGGRRSRAPRYDEDVSASDYGSFDEDEFEMVSTNRRGTGSSRASSRRGPEVRKIRIKAHVADDVRYIIVGTAVEFPDLVDRIRDKFALRRKFKIKVKDEDAPDGDMITMGDQDDLDIAISTSRTLARKQRQDTGKMEVSYSNSKTNESRD
jgi:hypothetical protein